MKNDCWCYHPVTCNEQKLFEGGLSATLRTKFKPGIASTLGMPMPLEDPSKRKKKLKFFLSVLEQYR